MKELRTCRSELVLDRHHPSDPLKKKKTCVLKRVM